MDGKEKIAKYKMLLENEAAKNDILEQKLQVLRHEKEDLKRQIGELKGDSGQNAQLQGNPFLLNDSHFLVARRLRELFALIEDGSDERLLEYLKAGLEMNEVERKVIDSFLAQYKDYKRTDYKNFCSQFSRIYIYGAGVKAKRCAKALQENGIMFEGFVVTNIDANAEKYLQHKVYSIKEIPHMDNDVGILVALNPTNAQQVYPVLDKLEIKNYCYFI